MPVVVEKRPFTVDEYHLMAEAGIFSEDERIELLEGDIAAMPPIGSYHASRVAKLGRLFETILGNSVIVWIQNPVHIDAYSEPEPDVALLKPQPDFYAKAHPTPEDVLLVVEVADTSLDKDYDIKLPLYARAGIREVWIINLRTRCVEIYTEPGYDNYETIRRFHKEKMLVSEVFPEFKITTEEILG
jgi:Uma2 family endonuclease